MNCLIVPFNLSYSCSGDSHAKNNRVNIVFLFSDLSKIKHFSNQEQNNAFYKEEGSKSTNVERWAPAMLSFCRLRSPQRLSLILQLRKGIMTHIYQVSFIVSKFLIAKSFFPLSFIVKQSNCAIPPPSILILLRTSGILMPFGSSLC